MLGPQSGQGEGTGEPYCPGPHLQLIEKTQTPGLSGALCPLIHPSLNSITTPWNSQPLHQAGRRAETHVWASLSESGPKNPLGERWINRLSSLKEPLR